MYGVTTGFGDLASTFVEPARSAELQEHLLMSHAVGVGEPFPREIVRAMLLLRANTLALGHSGCRPVVVDRLLAFLERGLHSSPSLTGRPRRLASSTASTLLSRRKGASARRATSRRSPTSRCR